MTAAKRLACQDHGSVMVEYVTVLTVVALGLALATYRLGPRLVGLYENQRAVLALPLL